MMKEYKGHKLSSIAVSGSAYRGEGLHVYTFAEPAPRLSTRFRP